ncbi:small conductance calcium-activated potassium channel protein-like [Watersipora subatra]|uniref:small conductance calcium-activated potassium channel protein-like n=1 Tax=Watersipora subatra TaxID=2589382 RepID=UPI00355B1873
MKASGALAISFKQLQKPSPVRNDTASDISRHISYDSKSNSEKNASAIGAEVRTVVHMREKAHANSQASHVIKVENTDEEPEPAPQHHHIGYRLGQRKVLAEQRRKIADLCCLSALFGLILMIVETECNIADVYTKADVPSYVIKGLITLSTLVLLVLIGLYHAVEVKLFVVDNCIEDWRIAMSWVRVVQIGAELVICSIHPPPGTCTFPWYVENIKTLEWKKADVPLDIIFSLPMFSRLYLIIRVLLLHSKLFTDASSRSIGALNKITFNTRFVLKTLMTIFPGTVMGLFMLSLWIICAWTFRACENFHDPLFKNFLNTLYMVAITFLSVGYGDFVPHTYCGRTISVISGLMGAGCTALVVAVIARKLELTRAEKHVHNFMLESQLNKKLKDAAANVLRETWLIYKYTRIVKRVNGRKVRAHQRKFLHAIQLLRLVKLKQRKLADQANSLTDFAKTTAQVHDIVGELRSAQENSNHRIKNIERSLQSLQAQIDALPQAVARIMAEKQTSTSSFLSANDASLQNSPKDRRDAACMALPKPMSSAQSSFDSCG